MLRIMFNLSLQSCGSMVDGQLNPTSTSFVHEGCWGNFKTVGRILAVRKPLQKQRLCKRDLCKFHLKPRDVS